MGSIEKDGLGMPCRGRLRFPDGKRRFIQVAPGPGKSGTSRGLPISSSPRKRGSRALSATCCPGFPLSREWRR